MKFGIIIISCDKFFDTWDIVSESFDRHFPYSMSNVYLVSNHLEFKHRFIKNIRVGDDVSWSGNLKKALNFIPETHVLLWLDDVFLTENVSQIEFNRVTLFCKQFNANYIRLNTCLGPSYWINSYFGEIKPDSLFYRASIFSSLWRKTVLFDLLVEGESAWDFEIIGSDRTKIYNGFYSVKYDLFSYIHGIEKGFWIKDSATKLIELKYSIDFDYRPLLSVDNQSNIFRYTALKKWIFHYTPARYRKKLLSIYQKFFKSFFV